MRRTLALLPLLLAGPVAAQPGGPFAVLETGQRFGTLQEAVSSIRLGTGTVEIAPGTYHECAVQSGGRITIRAARPGSVVFEGTACEGKAVLVLRGSESWVDGIVFRGIRVGDGNGAGIRTELGDLHVTNSMFLDSQEGILGGQPNGQRITIDRSTFAGLGQCDETPSCSHAIYLANLGQVTITRSRFERGRGGHYVKLRVPHVQITDNSFDDTAGHKTNYMIDLCQGGDGLIARNGFVQGRDKENWTGFVVVSAEARTYSTAGLRVTGNTARLAPGFGKSPAFVANASRQRFEVADNQLGAGIRAYEDR